MKLPVLQQNRGRSNSSSGDGTKSQATIFWMVIHCLCCLISLVLGFRFSRLVFFLLFSTSSTSNLYTTPFAADIAGVLSFTARINKTDAVASSRVVVGRHGIRIRPWPHPDPVEVMKAHTIMESVQREQRVQYGIKNPRSLIIITPTYVRTFQALHLTGLMHTLMNLPYNVVWIVVEAGGATNETASLLAKSNLQIKHIGFAKKMPIFWEARHKLESQMRLEALRVVRDEQLDGIVVFADDSNMHSLEFFDEIQKVEWIGAVSVGILANSVDSDEKDEKKSRFPIQGPACNSSNHLIGWHTFDSVSYPQKTANYIGDMAIVLPRKLEWCGFVMNSRLVWSEAEFRPEWIKDFDEVDEIENPLALIKDSSMVEPLGGCGKKVMVWWLRVEARADSKFPAGWRIDPSLEVTVPAKRTPWLDAPLEKHPTKTRTPRSRRTSRGKRKHDPRTTEK